MDSALAALFSSQFVLLALVVSFLVFIIRRVFEYFFPKLLASHFWNEIFLPVSPILLGGLIGAIAVAYPFPAGITTFSGRVICGLVAGGLGATVYRAIQGMLNMPQQATIMPALPQTQVIAAPQTQTNEQVQTQVEQTSQAKPTITIAPTDGTH